MASAIKEKVAILSTTSYRWALCDYGIISLGAVTVTVYPTLLPEHIKHIINDSGSKLIFVENLMQLEKVKTVYDDCPDLKYIVLMIQNLRAVLELRKVLEKLKEQFTG